MGWIGETMDSIKSLQIRQVLTQAVSLGSLPIFQSFFFFGFISLIRVWNWNCMCFFLSLGDNKLWVCIKNWSFILFFFLFCWVFFWGLREQNPTVCWGWCDSVWLIWIGISKFYFLVNRSKIKFHIHNHCLYGGLGDIIHAHKIKLSVCFLFLNAKTIRINT